MTVWLVGAGPGDPGLITAKGLELVRSCDALVYDRLVAEELVAEASDDALRIPREGLTQDEIDALLVELGREGLEVVRLKGGDPFVFGRGAEEALALEEAGVACEVVPGVSAAAAVPAAAGIPLTHRGVSAQVTIVSGRRADGSPLHYGRLVAAEGTLLVFMGLGQLESIVDGLLRHGADPESPAAVVSRGTQADQRTVLAPLRELAGEAAGLPGPALLVVGDVVAISRRLARPLAAATS